MSAEQTSVLTNWDRDRARQWLNAHNFDEGDGLGGLWEMVAAVVERHDRMTRHLAAQAWDEARSAEHPYRREAAHG